MVEVSRSGGKGVTGCLSSCLGTSQQSTPGCGEKTEAAPDKQVVG